MNTIQKCFSNVLKHLFAASCALALLAPAAAGAAPALSGSGTEASPYLITSSADMASFRDWVNAGNNCAGEYFSQTADIAITAWSGIGTSESASFQGVYDGGNKTISAQFDSGKYRGVFAYAKNATIKNLKVNVTGRTGIVEETGGAAFVGQSYGSTLQNLTATCDAGAMGTAEAPLTHNGGGIVVRMNGGTCYACTNKMDIHTSYTKVGGIAAFGQSSNTDYFELCSNEGALHRSYTGTGDGGCAGIIGWQGYSDFQPVNIKNCSSTGAITAAKTSDTGSFIGYKSEGGLTVSGINVGLADLRPVGMGGHNTPLLWFATVNTSVTPDTATFNGYALNASNKVMEANSAAITLANEGDYIILDTSLAAYSGTVSRSDAGAVTTTVLSGTVTRYEWALPTFTVNVAAGAGVENLQYKLGAAGEWTAYTAALANVAKGTVLVVKGTTSAAGYEVKDATVTVVADYPSETPLTINKSLIQYFPTAGTTGAYPGQDGSSANPFVLATADDYVALKLAVVNGTTVSHYYKQVADINLGSTETPWAGIGLNHVQNGWNETGTYGFSGTLDGGNYTVNVYMGGGRYHGLFNNAVDAVISNLTVNVTGWAASAVADDGGALCGICTRTTLQNIKTTASGTLSTDGNLGGVAGVARASTLIACTNEIDLTTTFWHVGGIVSYTDGLVATTIRNCMNEGALTSDRPSGYVGGGNPVSIGGILGWANGAATIDSCVNTGTLTTGANWGVPASTKFGYGSILGTWDQRVTTVTGVNVGQDNVAGCLHDVATLQWALPDTPSAGLVTFCTPETAVAGTVAYKAMYSNAKAFTLTAPNASLTIITNFAAYTGMVSLDASLLADDYELVIGGDADKVVYTAAIPTPALTGNGTEASPYLITSLADLVTFRDWVNAGNNCAGEYFSQTADIAITAWSGIGTSESVSFQGVYDGGNKTISAQFDSGKYRGVFAYAKNATIKNLKVNVTGRTGIATETGGAAFVGQSYGSTLQNLTATCDAGAMGTAETPLTHNGAGIVVRMNGGTCYGCTNKMDIYSSYTKVGGIAAFGQSTDTDYFELCSNEGTLYRSYTGTGDGGCAGIIGWQGYSDFQPVNIKNCSSTGAITAAKTSDTGSFIGYKSEGGLTVSGINVGLADLRPVGMGGHNTPLLWFATVNTSVTPDTATFNGYALNASNKVMEANSAAITLANEGDYIILDTSLAAYSGTVSRSDAGAVTTTVLSGTVTRYEWALPTFTVNVAAGAGVENLQYKLGAAGEWTAYTAALANVAKGTVLVVKGTTSAAGYEVKDATVTVVADYPSETPLTINKSLIQYFPTAGTTGAYPGQDGSSANPFVLATADDYVALKLAVVNGTTVSHYYKQVADINLGSTETPWAGIGLNHVQNGWNETGTYGFSGTLDGGNYTVNVYMGGGRYHGLFNNAVDAVISNLTVNVTGWAASAVADDGGALCGICTRTTLQNIKTTASGTLSTDGNLGGVAGVARASTLIACTNEIDLTTTFWHVGGIVSYTDGLVATTIRNCMNEGALTSDRPSGYVGGGNPVSIGGILGWANGAATIDSCVNTGTLTTGANWGVPASTKFGYGSILGTWDQRVTTVTGVNVGQDNVAGCLHDVATLQWALPDTPSAGLVTFCTPETAVAGTVAYKAMYSNAKAFTLTAPNASLTIITNFAAYTGMVSLDASLLADDYELVIGGDADKVVYTAAIPTPALTGNGTEASPYLITNLANLVTFRDWVNAGNDGSGLFFQLTTDIDLGGAEWTPIGTTDATALAPEFPFSGMFDGQNHSISNFKVTTGFVRDDDVTLVGFFGCIHAHGGYTAGVQSLTIDGATFGTMAQPNTTIGALAPVITSDAGTPIVISGVSIVNSSIFSFGYYGQTGLAAFLGANHVTVENCVIDIDFWMPDTGKVGYRFWSPGFGQVEMIGDNQQLIYYNFDASACRYYHPTTCTLTGNSGTGTQTIWVYWGDQITVFACGTYIGQIYKTGYNVTIDGMSYTQTDTTTFTYEGQYANNVRVGVITHNDFTDSYTYHLADIAPDSATAGGGNFTLTVYGSYFTESAKVFWGATELATTYVSSTQLTAVVVAEYIATPGTASVTVGGTGVAKTFTVEDAAQASVIVPEGGADTVDVTIPNTNGLCFVRFYNGFGDRGFVTYRYTGEDTFTFFTGDLAPGTYDYEVFYSGTAVPPGYKPAAEATGGQPAATVVGGVPKITVKPVSGLYYTIFAGADAGSLTATANSVLATPADEQSGVFQIPVAPPSDPNGVKFFKIYASDEPYAADDPAPGPGAE